MQELGELLREARLEKGMSLEEVENLTKIRKRYLEAIEEGEYKVLPGPFYVRAFVKSYAETVGLDSDHLLKLYRNVIPDPGTEAQIEAAYPQTRRRRNINTEKWSKVASTIVFICFLIVIIAAFYFYAQQNREPRDEFDENIPITQREDHSPANNSGRNTGNDPVEPGSRTGSQPDTEPEIEPELEPALVKVGTENGTDIYELKNADKLYIRMESENAECWYAVYNGAYNDEQIDTGKLNAGESKNYEFEQSGHFHLGYAKTIKLTVNGIEFKPSEREGVHHIRVQLAQTA